MSTDSETRGWKRDTTGNYFKAISEVTYWLFRGTRHDGKPAGYWFVRKGHRHGNGYVGEWLSLSDAKRAAHAHARETK